EFQIDGASGIDGLDIGMLEGVGDDGDVEFRSFHVEDSEADAVEADGTFFNDEVAELFGEFEAELPGAIRFFSVGAGSGGIDMTLDDVAVETAVHREAAFKIYKVAGGPGAQVGLFERFVDGGDTVE